MKGKIDLDTLKKKLEHDVINNMKLADKEGVFNVIKQVVYDAQENMKWIDRRRAQKLKERTE